MKKIFESFVRNLTNVLKDKWEKQVDNGKQVEIDVTMEMKRLTFDVITSAGFGVELDCLKNSDDRLASVVDKVFSLVMIGVTLGNLARIPLIFKKYWDVSVVVRNSYCRHKNNGLSF